METYMQAVESRHVYNETDGRLPSIIEDELFTLREFSRFKLDALPRSWFRQVRVSRRQTFRLFGVRFPVSDDRLQVVPDTEPATEV